MSNLWILGLYPLTMFFVALPSAYIVMIGKEKSKKRKALKIYGLLIALDFLLIYPLALFHANIHALIVSWFGSLIGLIFGAVLLELFQN